MYKVFALLIHLHTYLVMCNNKVQQKSVTRLKTAPQHAITIPKASENASLLSKIVFLLLQKL